jgi:hypothetical protein
MSYPNIITWEYLSLIVGEMPEVLNKLDRLELVHVNLLDQVDYVGGSDDASQIVYQHDGEQHSYSDIGSRDGLVVVEQTDTEHQYDAFVGDSRVKY